MQHPNPESLDLGSVGSWGMRVRVRWSEAAPTEMSAWTGPETTRRNVTEIHWRYLGAPTHSCVAFESDIHCTGDTIPVDWIAEFEAMTETERAPDFWTPAQEEPTAAAK